MATKVETTEEDSFIVLGTSPGASMEMNGFYGNASIEHTQLDDALKDLSAEASMAFKAHFKLGDTPSPASLMAASTIVTEDTSTEELQKRFGEILDENVILKETLKKNNDSMKEQFLLIASCQEDMMKTHMAHKEKFDETRELVEKLRLENKKLKQDVTELQSLASSSQSTQSRSEGEGEKSGPSSALEFVTAPDDDTINKLTAQLELVEKQRRQVIVDNDKLTWQKESLERIVDATTKERDELKDKVRSLELRLSTLETEYTQKINEQNYTIQDLDTKLRTAQNSRVSLAERDSTIQQLEKKVSTLQSELKSAQLKILDFENVKLEYSKQKAGASDTVRAYKDQIQELSNRLKEAQTTVFQPVRVSITDSETSNPEYGGLVSNVKLYDKTLKHLSELLNLLTHGASDSLVQTLGLVTSLHDFKLDKTTADQFKSSLAEVKQQLEKQHSNTLKNVGQVRSTLTIFEGIFKDYNEVLDKLVAKQQVQSTKNPNVDALTAALVARGQELQSLEAEVKRLKEEKDERELLRAQLELYKTDFEAERESREKMASEKETIMTDLRTTQRRNQELLMQLEEVRKLNPNIYRSATMKRSPPQTAQARPTASRPFPATGTNSATGNMVYTCPKCMRFSSDQYKVMEDHFDFCLDDF